jgi:hypothetical protein
MKKNFKDIYKLPLSVCNSHVYVWTENGVMAFNNLVGFEESDVAYLNSLVAAINGDESGVYNAEAKGGRILVNGKKVLLARGWGHLTGGGALNLPADVAAKMQDDFIAFCVSQLRRDLEGKEETK